MQGQFITLLLHYRYLAIVPIAIIEGPVISMVCGMLLRYGYFSFWPLFLSLMISDLIGDAWWYFLGYVAGSSIVASRIGKRMKADKLFDAVKILYRRYHSTILLISKLTMGLGVPSVILSAAGALKISFKKYMGILTAGQVIWTGGMMAIGYFLGDAYQSIGIGFHWVSLVTPAITLFLILLLLGRYFRNKTLDTADKLIEAHSN